MPPDGLLVIDKPVGPTSHDVVSRVRRILRERRVGHTGTLDPLASGLLLLVVGRATRLAQFMSADAKRYDATIRLGFSTDTYDALGRPSAAHIGPLPTRDRIEDALSRFRGTFAQQPPAFSAKKIQGRRSYQIARAATLAQLAPSSEPASARSRRSASGAEAGTLPAPVAVTVNKLDIMDISDDLVRIDLVCSSGFYVRSLAHDLGVALGVGGHLTALRRTESSGRTLGEAVSLPALEEPATGPDLARRALIPLADVLPDLPRLTLTPEGVRRAVTGCDLGERDVASESPSESQRAFPGRVRLLDRAHNLVGIADLRPSGLLHPVVILM